MIEDFAICMLQPMTEGEGVDSSITHSKDGTWKTSSFYLDSSGCSTIFVPLRLSFPSKAVFDWFVASQCLDLKPNILPPKSVDEVEGTTDDDVTVGRKSRFSFGVEAKVLLTSGSGEAVASIVEKMTIITTSIDAQAVTLLTEINIRVSRSPSAEPVTAAQVNTTIEVGAYLAEKFSTGNTGDAVSRENPSEAVSRDLLSLTSADFHGFGHRPLHREYSMIRLRPLSLRVTLTHAFSTSSRSVAGKSPGQTLIALTIRHSNTHDRAVLVTDISLHPCHSRLESQNMLAASRAVDMVHAVNWGLDQHLPLKIMPYEAFSTLIRVDATDDVGYRSFTSPLAVKAVVGKDDQSRYRYHVTVESQVQWKTSRAAVEPIDAFRLDVRLAQQEYAAGTEFSIFVKISNLGTDPKDVNLRLVSDKQKTKNCMEVSGFSIVGLDDPVSMFRYCEKLCMMDDEIQLGRIEGLGFQTAELRLLSLQEGIFFVPHFCLTDQASLCSYICQHNLSIVVR